MSRTASADQTASAGTSVEVPAIATSGLRKAFGSRVALHDLTLRVEPGEVFGFLGPNGAGKSTTMRVMVGLTPPSHGQATVVGRRYADLPNPGLEVGVLLDASAQHAGRTGRETLRLAARTMGLPLSRVDEMLDVFVGLTRVLFEAPGVGESAHLHCTDTEGEWLITFPAPSERVVTREHAKGDVAVRGTAPGMFATQ